MNNNIFLQNLAQSDIFLSTCPWIIGAHIPISKTLLQTIKDAINSGMYSFQFFLGSPQSFKRRHLSSDDIKESIQLTTHYPMCIFSHAPYIFNLAGSKASLAWNGDTTQDQKTMSAINELSYELSILANFKVNGVVIHPGCFKDRTKGLKTIGQSINKIEFKENSKLLLETSAGQGDTLATSFLEIKTILENVIPNKRKYVGVCVDTAHIWGSGEYEINKIEEVDRMFSDFDNILGKEKFGLLHLNDSEVKFNSKKDRHSCISEGYIWKEDITSFIYLMNECKRRKIPVVLETIPEDVYNVWNIYESSIKKS